MDWTQTYTIIGTMAALFAIIIGLMIYLFTRLDSDINKLTNRLDRHASRIDQLYQMFIDLLKAAK